MTFFNPYAEFKSILEAQYPEDTILISKWDASSMPIYYWVDDYAGPEPLIFDTNPPSPKGSFYPYLMESIQTVRDG